MTNATFLTLSFCFLLILEPESARCNVFERLDSIESRQYVAALVVLGTVKPPARRNSTEPGNTARA